MSFIKFLGTAGARFVMIKQLRSSGGLWINHKDTNVILDPGPGALVRCHNARPILNPETLDGVILTHKHLDHSNDANVMVEAMTQGGFKKRGALFVPKDAVGSHGVIFPYITEYVGEIIYLNYGERLKVGDITFEVSSKNIHPTETYGLKFFIDDEIVGIVSDTRYFPKLIEYYKDVTILILNVVFFERHSEIDHLCIDDAMALIKKINPKKTILTHFGMSMLDQKPYILQKDIQSTLEMNVTLAYDGYSINLPLDE
jgi:ribonuclease BN (tRNA processing enzyme)